MKAGEWNPYDAIGWSKVLGLVHVPLFSVQAASQQPGTHAVLLDGQLASFTFSVCDDSRELEDKPLSWAWSADVNHAVIVDSKRSEFFVRRWDQPTVRRFKVPTAESHAQELFSIFREGGATKSSDVVSHVLRAFRQVRKAMKDNDSADSVLIFTALLVAVERVQKDYARSEQLMAAHRVADIFQFLENTGGVDAEFRGVREDTELISVGDLLRFFLEPVGRTNCLLDPSLLLRHASGRLFQEANLVLEREPAQQLHFAGMAPEKRLQGTLDRDVRFTPPPLARALTEQSLRFINVGRHNGKEVIFFDPACGSGVFLVEALRECQARGIVAAITLVGFDISEVSCRIARFCLKRAINEGEQGIKANIEVRACDALREGWPDFDVLLMNPPFIPWNRMDDRSREVTQEILGDLNEGHSDLAMAFVWKAANKLTEEKSLGTVIPAPLLESRAALKWREALHKVADLRLLGKFEGFRYFVASIVEPAFVVLTGKDTNGDRATPETTVVIARTGFEDQSLRALRLNLRSTEYAGGWEIYSDPQAAFAPNNWMPMWRQQQVLRTKLLSRGLTTIGELFDVRQGIRAGHKCFSISVDDYKQLPTKERTLFRPVATNSTIREGRLFKTEYIFYPYRKDGPVIETEDQLTVVATVFAKNQLLPFKEQLQKRSGVNPMKWWLLTRERSWQHQRSPKLVSSYFGGSGRFAFDNSGEFVVHQGQAWLWKQRAGDALLDEDPNTWFVHTKLPFAYVAVLNSGWFEQLLGLWCPRVLGGQFDLSNRFVDKIPMPDLSSGDVTGESVDALANLGRAISQGKEVQLNELNIQAARAYGATDLLVKS